MSKNDFTKTMRNIAASDNHETGRYNRSSNRTDRIHSEIIISPSDKARLENFTKQETAYYNSLVEAFSPRARAFPESLLGLTEEEEELYAYVAMSNKPVTPILRAGNREALTDGLKKFETLLFGKTEKPSKMSFDKASVIDIGAISATLLPEVRRNMAVEFLHHYQAQAKKIVAPTGKSDDSVYKEPPEFLVEMTYQQKRHLQIPRKSLQLKWDAEHGNTLVWCQYVAKPMVVKDMNLVENSSWNYMVLHQDHVSKITPATPWVIDLRKNNSGYLLKTIDSAEAWRSKIFNEAKKRNY